MLNYADTASSSTIVSVESVPRLAALLTRPDFQEGLREGQECFQEGMFWEDHEKAWTEDEIIAFVTEELSEEKYRRGQCYDRVMGHPSLSYLHHLGFAISYLGQALATAKAQ